MLRDNWPVIDWREPIGLQERLEGRSPHNGEISVMSRSRFQGTEVTIVTGAFSPSSIVVVHFECEINCCAKLEDGKEKYVKSFEK